LACLETTTPKISFSHLICKGTRMLDMLLRRYCGMY
jgi:hypothetical protein